jgi:hypothetical protein
VSGAKRPDYHRGPNRSLKHVPILLTIFYLAGDWGQTSGTDCEGFLERNICLSTCATFSKSDKHKGQT